MQDEIWDRAATRWMQNGRRDRAVTRWVQGGGGAELPLSPTTLFEHGTNSYRHAARFISPRQHFAGTFV